MQKGKLLLFLHFNVLTWQGLFETVLYFFINARILGKKRKKMFVLIWYIGLSVVAWEPHAASKSVV